MQEIVAFSILFLAIGYLAKKFLLPKSLFASSKKDSTGCGQDNCGCH